MRDTLAKLSLHFLLLTYSLQINLNTYLYSKNVQKLFNVDPHETRGEEILTRYEDNYKFHRYTNRFGNAFGAETYSISITCRSIFTDPEIHQKLHDTHYDKQARYYGYWYGQDLFAFDSQREATRTNALVEASLAGSWLTLGFLLAGLLLVFIQRFVLKKQEEEAERMSMHSTMMGSMHHTSVAGTFPRNGSVMSGSMRGSNFQRGGSLRGSDRSMKSTRRDIDDIALSMHHMGGSQFLGAATAATAGGYGRKDIDDMVRQSYFKANTYEAEQPHGLMILDGDGLLAQQQRLVPLQVTLFFSLHENSRIFYIGIFCNQVLNFRY